MLKIKKPSESKSAEGLFIASIVGHLICDLWTDHDVMNALRFIGPELQKEGVKNATTASYEASKVAEQQETFIKRLAKEKNINGTKIPAMNQEDVEQHLELSDITYQFLATVRKAKVTNLELREWIKEIPNLSKEK